MNLDMNIPRASERRAVSEDCLELHLALEREVYDPLGTTQFPQVEFPCSKPLAE